MMKALSIKEPWATLINDGQKTIETRTWKTNFRGKILLCASAKPASSLSGHAFAVAEIIDCRPMTEEDEKLAKCDVYDRAHSWVLANVTPIAPFSVKGQLGLFNIDYEEKE